MSQGLKGLFAGALGRFRLDAAFALAPTGLTALTGPSGCGKTTLLRCIAGLTRLPGSLSLDGEVWQDSHVFVPPHRRPVGMVFQDAGLLTHLSVKANLTYGLKRAPKPHAIALEEVTELLGLASLLDRAPDTLSGGERQRVAIGRALLAQPRLLLMDEPLSSLDLEAKAEIMPYIERLHRSRAMPILYVSHDPTEVRALADHLLVMADGRIVSSIADVRAAAEAERVAAEQALGAMESSEIGRLALAALLAGLKPA